VDGWSTEWDMVWRKSGRALELDSSGAQGVYRGSVVLALEEDKEGNRGVINCVILLSAC